MNDAGKDYKFQMAVEVKVRTEKIVRTKFFGFKRTVKKELRYRAALERVNNLNDRPNSNTILKFPFITNQSVFKIEFNTNVNNELIYILEPTSVIYYGNEDTKGKFERTLKDWGWNVISYDDRPLRKLEDVSPMDNII